MRPDYLLVLITAVLLNDALCYPSSEKEETHHEQPSRINSTNSAVFTSNADFAFHLYKKISSDKPDSNVLMSPLSISTAFALLSLGARRTTLTQTLEGLRFNLTEIPEADIHQGFQQIIRSLNLPNKEFQLNIGNALFVSKTMELLEKFQEDSKNLYSAEVLSVDFEDCEKTKQDINDYIKNQTRDKIVDMLNQLDPHTVMVLVNYIFFKAKWQVPFRAFKTAKEEFFVNKSKVVEVPMMNRDSLYTRIFQDKELSCTVVEMNYEGDARALFILPDEEKMKTVEDALHPEVLKKWDTSLQRREIKITLPKFSISNSYDLKDILSAVGISEVFSSRANLSGIAGYDNLKVSKATHKAVLDVDETGTEAAAATTIELMLTSMMISNPLEIKLNRPFLTIILADKNILFMAKINNPQNE